MTVKTPDEITADWERWFHQHWHNTYTPEFDKRPFPYDLPLGRLASDELDNNFPAVRERIRQLTTWAEHHQIDLRYGTRLVHGTRQHIPTHATFPTLDIAAAVTGTLWTERLTRGQHRWLTLADHFPHIDPSERAKVVRDIDTWTDTNVQLLITGSHYFANNSTEGMTAREVPIPGMHTKWIDTHRKSLKILSGHPEKIDNLIARPEIVHFTYLDEQHRASGGRHHDSHAVGDQPAVAYTPRVIIICENKDSAQRFPYTEKAIAIQGNGKGPHAILSLPWLADAEHVIYWGDIDTDAFEILNSFRAAGIPATSILMNESTFTEYLPYATETDKDGKPLTGQPPRTTDHLTPPERDLYLSLCDETRTLPRRLEQEKIPLPVAHNALTAALSEQHP
jgi:hypothetical protein